MANTKISELGATSASGSSIIPIVKGGYTMSTTAQDIANLGAKMITLYVINYGSGLQFSELYNSTTFTLGNSSYTSPTYTIELNGSFTYSQAWTDNPFLALAGNPADLSFARLIYPSFSSDPASLNFSVYSYSPAGNPVNTILISQKISWFFA